MTVLRSFNPLKLIGLVLLAVFFARYFLNTGIVLSSLLHGFILVVHEAGHIFMGPLGRFFMFLGGTLWQIVVPVLICLYFALTGQRFSAAITLFLVGFAFVDAAVYIEDARARALPLITFDRNTHDWWNLLRMLDLLEYDRALARLFYLEGFACYLGAVLLGVRYAKKQAEAALGTPPPL